MEGGRWGGEGSSDRKWGQLYSNNRKIYIIILKYYEVEVTTESSRKVISRIYLKVQGNGGPYIQCLYDLFACYPISNSKAWNLTF